MLCLRLRDCLLSVQPDGCPGEPRRVTDEQPFKTNAFLPIGVFLALLAVALAIPFGLGLGHHARVRLALLPAVNFFRNLSPLAWIPFAVLWFGIGDASPIFLIFLSAFFPVVLATMSA